MGIYIPGMEMPKRGHTITITIVGSGQAYVEHFDCRPHVEETIEYTAVPVPAHGRLVDADAFSAEMRERQDAARKWKEEAKDSETAARADAVLSFLSEVKLTLDKMPAVIPEEDEA